MRIFGIQKDKGMLYYKIEHSFERGTLKPQNLEQILNFNPASTEKVSNVQTMKISFLKIYDLQNIITDIGGYGEFLFTILGFVVVILLRRAYTQALKTIASGCNNPLTYELFVDLQKK